MSAVLRIFLWLSGVLAFAVLSIGLKVLHFYFTDPEGFTEYRQSVTRDMNFAEDWMFQFAENGNQRRCRLLALPIGYRCFYYETFREMELREMTVPGVFSIWLKGLELIWKGDPELANQSLVTGGVPAEDKKLSQFQHWSRFILRELSRAISNSPLLVQGSGASSAAEVENKEDVNE